MKPGLKVALTVAATLPMLSGCQGAVLGNLAVLIFTFGIFLGTITLGRPRD